MMSATVIALPRRAPKKPRVRREPTRKQLLTKLGKQADLVRHNHDWGYGPELKDLARAVRLSPERARSVSWRGIKFKIAHGWIMRSPICPLTNRPLVGVVG